MARPTAREDAERVVGLTQALHRLDPGIHPLGSRVDGWEKLGHGGEWLGLRTVRTPSELAPWRTPSTVIPGLDPRIHALGSRVNGRNKPGHDGE
ncbi:hypothetical protein GCM10007036_19320 [Alsobacter metallidurans]|uniref:Uncharacterized protein n=1 Tax=Alsobacter metallidurans TaxID=340221 RepID=A0A917I763_9HYPH|nr:hypothetical protein GCM10007036_19320 [Alsobacter metallidurans]